MTVSYFQRVTLIRVFPLFFLLFLSACATFSQNAPAQSAASAEVSWPPSDATLAIRETDFLEFRLRLLALEMNQEQEGQVQYFMYFFPRMGKIEVFCRFLPEKKALSKRKKAGQSLQETWRKRLDFEVDLIKAGVLEAMAELNLAQGFEPEKHLEIHFQIKNLPYREFAVYEGGEINWLALPQSMASSGKNPS